MQAFDLHLHTKTFSDCSFIDPEDLIRRAAQLGLQGVALTEHGMRWPDGKFDELRRLADPYGLLLINGQEILASSPRRGMEGEYLIFGLRKSLWGNFSAKELVERVQGEGGIIIAAHPYKLSRGGGNHYYGAGDLIYELDLDALEYYHPGHNDRALAKVRKAMEDLGLPGTGSSDAHKIFEAGSFVTFFEREIRREEDFILEVREGRIGAGKNPVDVLGGKENEKEASGEKV
ncbi:MAG: PHP domain-containing protein [Syntrophaceae bacterium]|nr:PHP domain-containing protein [Syntrophaceae bacterium]